MTEGSALAASPEGWVQPAWPASWLARWSVLAFQARTGPDWRLQAPVGGRVYMCQLRSADLSWRMHTRVAKLSLSRAA
eukprot:NODE_5236_length_722_cov_3.086181_g4404_i0.p2 GENE.NODE_5236_length_722_cov_3.086181_g4404_i0~~NODE_5236_length_722_cov_3.086181_g4404_i0.p2  ORF type:complete len:78 (-),score=0.32 NODE_5236_length_722_cov_3.086181_g4404_i0:4-237(-)